MHLSAYGQFAHDQWLTLADAYPHIDLGEFVVMPNHVHGMIYVGDADDAADVGDAAGGGDAADAGDAAGGGDAADAGISAGGGKPLPYGIIDDSTVREGLAPSLAIPDNRPTLSAIIGAYKSLTYHDCLDLANANNKRLGKLWHRSYYEIIIRTPEAARRIRHYIRNNVLTWARDKFYGR
jgi:putative transposase